jgi:hypothetical protein
MMTLERLFDGSSEFVINKKIEDFNFEVNLKKGKKFDNKTSTKLLIQILQK